MYKPKYKHYNITNVCDNIKEDGNRCKNKLIRGDAYREYDNKGKWTGRWLCRNCRGKNFQKNNPNSSNNIHKLLTNRRTGNLDQNSASGKGDKFQELTCIWRGVKDLNIENDNYSYPIDHSKDPELGTIQTQGRSYSYCYDCWSFTNLERDHHKEFDNMICYCASGDGNIIERIFIFPKNEILKRKGITILRI